MSFRIVIPARYASVRLPGKPLLEIAGKTMLEYVYEKACACQADDVIMHAAHPYTKALIAAVCEPVAGKVGVIKDVPIKGEIPSAEQIPAGCRFHPRCLYAMPKCQEEQPELLGLGTGHSAACHLLS